MQRFTPANEHEMRALGAKLAQQWRAGDLVCLEGELGAGKTTLVRGALEGIGYHGVVRSPTFNLIQTYDTSPPVLHADLYRLANAHGLGLEEYEETHLCLIEWPDRLGDWLRPGTFWRVRIEFAEPGRNVLVFPPRAPRGG